MLEYSSKGCGNTGKLVNNVRLVKVLIFSLYSQGYAINTYMLYSELIIGKKNREYVEYSCPKCSCNVNRRVSVIKDSIRRFGDRECTCRKCQHSKRVNVVCESCGANHMVTAPRFNKGGPFYCSVRCSKITHNKYEDHIRDDTSPTTKSITDPYRVLLFERDNFRCVECGQDSNWNGKTLTLQLDHIDGNNNNNKPSNIRTLCPNCHTQTATYAVKKSAINIPRGTKDLL